MAIATAAQPAVRDYTFPRAKLTLQRDASKTPLVLVACGSFSPITCSHVRMFEMSPVGDAYKKPGLAPAIHRLRMCELAVESSGWLMVDHWEAANPKYIRTAKVLDHFEHQINVVLGGVEKPDGTKVKAKISLLAGADLIQTMSTPNVWSKDDLDHILGRYGAFIIEREGTDIDAALSSLQRFKDNIHVRSNLREELSIRDLVPSSVIGYIEEHNLFREDGTCPMKENEKVELCKVPAKNPKY